MISPATGLLTLGDERFVSLSTFRRSGEEVPTAVWVAREGASLVVITSVESGKVGRLRHDPRVRVRPCDRRGRVAEDAPVADGVADVVEDAAEQEAPRSALARKYGLEWRAVMLVQRLARRGEPRRVILRLTASPETAGTDPV